MTPLNGLRSSGKIATSIANAVGCNDGPACRYTESQVDQTHSLFFHYFNSDYHSSDIQHACEGAEVAIVCLGTGR